MKAYKIVVTGPFNAGKTAFVRTASDIAIVSTEQRITNELASGDKTQTTVALDYGHAKVGNVLLHLYGTPGQERFEFMWGILSHKTDAFILLVDSEDRGSLMDAVRMLRLMRKGKRVPYLVAANKQDGRTALSPEKIARLLKLPASVPVVSCVAHDTRSVRRVLKRTVGILA